MEHLHSFTGDTKVHVLQRDYLGEGRYFQRGLCKGLKEGDYHMSWLDRNYKLKVDKILVQRDAKGRHEDPSDAIGAYYEAELVDESWGKAAKYDPMKKISLQKMQ